MHVRTLGALVLGAGIAAVIGCSAGQASAAVVTTMPGPAVPVLSVDLGTAVCNLAVNTLGISKSIPVGPVSAVPQLSQDGGTAVYNLANNTLGCRS